MPNRTEMLHFRATPEEKETIRENAGHAELALSEWMRQRSLDRLVPTQPVVEASYHNERLKQRLEDPEFREEFEREKATFVDGASQGETYEQFMERRMGELIGEGETEASMALRRAAAETAEAEWAQR